MRSGLTIPVLATVALVACGDRRDAADMAVGVVPFEQLRGMDVVALRSGMVRALRRSAEAAPYEGLRESIGPYAVVYSIPGFTGDSAPWPNEEALIMAIEGTRDWPSDASARAGWRAAVKELQAGLGVAPSCGRVAGPGFEMQVAEWDRGGGWSVSATFAPGDASLSPPLTARHSIAIRREALSTQLPREGAPNPKLLPTWTGVPCAFGGRSDSTPGSP